MEESKYLKIFGTHADYIAYVNGDGKIFPNVSYCVNNNDIHYNSYGKIVSKFDASPNNITRFIYIDDFPDSVCELFYDGDMVAFKQDFIQNYQDSNKYVYTGEMLEYDNNQYYLWEYEQKDEIEGIDEVKYLLTDTLDFTGKSLVENINNNYVPFIARLSSDKQTTYEMGTDKVAPILIYSKSSLKIVDDIDYVSEIDIDGEKLPNVVQYLQIEDEEEHNISITFKNTSRIGDYCFYQCKGLQSIEIPKTVKIIGDAAFEESGLTGNLIIPNTVTQIGEDAFNSCVNLTSVSIPESVTMLPDGAFQDCSGLTELVLHSKIDMIGDFTFGRCTGLQSITILAEEPPSLGPSAFDDTNDCPIYVPAASVNAYKAASGWSDYASRIQAIQ